MPYLNLDMNYFDHIKTVRLVGLLGKGAAELPIRLWAYCGKHRAKDGSLAGYSAQEIETIIGWWGDTGKCIDAFIRVGFLERTTMGFQIHEWEEHEGHLVTFHERAKVAAKARWNASSMLQALPDEGLSNAPTLPTKPSKPTNLTKAPEGEYRVPIPEKDPAGALVMAYKLAKGVAYDDRTWDKKWGRWAKAAADLLAVCGNDFKLAVRCLDEKGKELEKAGCNWTLETIVTHSHDWKNKQGGKVYGTDDRQRFSRALAEARAKERAPETGGLVASGEILAGVRGIPPLQLKNGASQGIPGSGDETASGGVPKSPLETEGNRR